MADRNQISRRRDWTQMAFAQPFKEAGATFEELCFDEQVGREAVLLLVDTAPEELLAQRTLTIELKAGIASTEYGPVLFPVVPGMVDTADDGRQAFRVL